MTFEENLNTIKGLKTDANNSRGIDDFKEAKEYILTAIAELKILRDNYPDLLPANKEELQKELVDCYGILGGLYRRLGLLEKDISLQKTQFKNSFQSYDKGYDIDKDRPQKNSGINSYNRVNRLISRIFYQPDCLTQTSDLSDINIPVELGSVKNDLQKQTENDSSDVWTLADLALVNILLAKENPISAFKPFVNKVPPSYAYDSLLSTLVPLAKLDTSVKASLQEAVEYLSEKSSG